MSKDDDDEILVILLLATAFTIIIFIVGGVAGTYSPISGYHLSTEDANKMCTLQYGEDSTFVKVENGHIYCKEPPLKRNNASFCEGGMNMNKFLVILIIIFILVDMWMF